MNSKLRSLGWLCGSTVCLVLVYFAYDHLVKPARHAAMCKAHLTQLSLALRNYHDRCQRFPPACTVGSDGTPWHSWRVYILPELGEQKLYDAYRFDEPWNGPHNAQLGSRMPGAFGFRGESSAKFLAVTGQYTAWPGTSSSRLREFHNGTSKTIMLVECADSEINWLEPRDIPIEQATKWRKAATGPRLTGRYDRAAVVFADGVTRALNDTISERTLRRLLRTGPTGETKSAPDADFPQPRDASSFAKTDVLPYPTMPILPGRNCLYCATFRIAWDQLRKSPNQPVAVDPAPAIATELNRVPFSLDNLDPGSFFAKTVDKADVVKMKKELQLRFPGATGPSTPPAETVQEGRVLYAYLLKSLPFADAFNGNTGPLSFPRGSKTAQVASFGQSLEAHSLVHIADYRTDEDFIIELKTQSDRDVMLLAKIPAESTLQATMDKVLARVTSPNPQHTRFNLDHRESLRVPKLSFNIQQKYDDLVGIEIVGSTYSKSGRPELIASAEQGTAFVLNERGAKLESTAEIETDISADIEPTPLPPPPPIRKFHFDRPFLVLLRERKSQEPYFALWLENTELMEPWPNAATEKPAPP